MINPLFGVIMKYLKLPDLDNVILDVQDLISFNFSLTDLHLENLHINPSIDDDSRFINLYGDDMIRLTLANFSGGIHGSYSYVSDPPILADIGDIKFDSKSFGIVIDGVNHFEDNHLQVDMKNLTMSFEPVHLQFDGISDISNVTSRLITYVTNTITSRLSSISRYPPSTKKLNNLINSVLRIIPDSFHIPGSNVTLEGGIDDHLHSTKHGFIMIPLDLWLQEDNHPLAVKNDAHFSQYTATDDEIQLYLSEYLLESLINVAYYYNNTDGTDSILKLPPINLKALPIPLYSTEIGLLLIGTSFMNEFGLGKECEIIV